LIAGEAGDDNDIIVFERLIKGLYVFSDDKSHLRADKSRLGKERFSVSTSLVAVDDLAFTRVVVEWLEFRVFMAISSVFDSTLVVVMSLRLSLVSVIIPLSVLVVTSSVMVISSIVVAVVISSIIASVSSVPVITPIVSPPIIIAPLVPIILSGTSVEVSLISLVSVILVISIARSRPFTRDSLL
jgi:hypothetical protein